jgi:hypothetical protein
MSINTRLIEDAPPLDVSGTGFAQKVREERKPTGDDNAMSSENG